MSAGIAIPLRGKIFPGCKLLLYHVLEAPPPGRNYPALMSVVPGSGYPAQCPSHGDVLFWAAQR